MLGKSKTANFSHRGSHTEVVSTFINIMLLAFVTYVVMIQQKITGVIPLTLYRLVFAYFRYPPVSVQFLLYG